MRILFALLKKYKRQEMFYKKTALFIIQHWKKNCFSLCFFTEKMYFCVTQGYDVFSYRLQFVSILRHSL